MPLTPKLTEPLIAFSRRDKRAENELFLRLQDMASEPHPDYNCAVQGSADGIAIDFRNWLQRKGYARTPPS